ncbi:YbcC family protein [Arenimonas alkanexedens]
MSTDASAADTACANPAGSPRSPVIAEELERSIQGACQRIAPLWPLRHFVAVNPFLGFSGQTFAATCLTMRRVAGAEMLMPRRFYRDALASGFITDADLAVGLRNLSPSPRTPADPASFRRTLAREIKADPKRRRTINTIADVLDAVSGGDRYASRTAFMIDEISRWCAGYFDQGPTGWKMPARQLEPYAAWRATMRFDRNAEAFGIKGFRAAIAAMPADPRDAIAMVVEALDIPAHRVQDYLHRALFDISGWAGHLRYLGWNNALYGRPDDRIVDLLAIRLVWGYALFQHCTDRAFREAWAISLALSSAASTHEPTAVDPGLADELAVHRAYEAAVQRRLIERIASRQNLAAPVPTPRSAVQAVFCIDVRSEVFRRALETVSSDVETLGFAGFFGYPIEYVPLGQSQGGAQCPVLLKPAFTVCEEVAGGQPADTDRLLRKRSLRQRTRRAWDAFKLSAVSSFTFVETAGLLYAAKLVGDAVGASRPVPHPASEGLSRSASARLAPRLSAGRLDGRASGFDRDQRVSMAETVLRAMSLTQGFARLVLLAGHGSSTVNNPYATGLDCGACGGHTGEANARVAAGLLNGPEVRDALRDRGIAIPGDTWFVAGLHDTTTDLVRLFDTDQMPVARGPDLARLRLQLDQAGALARLERAALLGIASQSSVDAEVMARSRDWSQVRPEWGLAGNSAFIAAPRACTRGLDLGGHAFLHSYDWRSDTGFGVLELIMTAPMVVASWINLQYFGSTVDNGAFGAGNKTLHNVVAGIGVLEGNAGDLKVGLPWQSVHDGRAPVHTPVRLSVVIAAPLDAINAVIARHQAVRELVDNEWLHLFAMDDHGRVTQRYAGQQTWVALP